MKSQQPIMIMKSNWEKLVAKPLGTINTETVRGYFLAACLLNWQKEILFAYFLSNNTLHISWNFEEIRKIKTNTFKKKRFGEIVNLNLIRDKTTGKSKGFGFVCYENQLSTDLAVDNFNGTKVTIWRIYLSFKIFLIEFHTTSQNE